jgi:hypothetical protein
MQMTHRCGRKPAVGCLEGPPAVASGLSPTRLLTLTTGHRRVNRDSSANHHGGRQRGPDQQGQCQRCGSRPSAEPNGHTRRLSAVISGHHRVPTLTQHDTGDKASPAQHTSEHHNYRAIGTTL